LDDENGKLKTLLAEQILDNAMLRDINSKKVVTPVEKRQAVTHLMEIHQVSQRRVMCCSLIGHRCAICHVAAMMLSCVMQ
jgi:hypothetical protein|tara:strand:- start:502 stop:741 length:240 start_codon:yes stop_codon:yes gene_type:complete